MGYSANVKSLWGKGFALLGNAGEFLDPVFSSGVTIAFKSASLATQCLAREFAGETVDWQADYAVPLKSGVDTFRAFVDAWYAGGFQKIIFHERHTPDIRRMIVVDPGGLRVGPEATRTWRRPSVAWACWRNCAAPDRRR